MIDTVSKDNADVMNLLDKDIGHELMTPREQEILRLLAEGHSARKIAEKLCISPRTAENHRTHIMKKLGLHSTLDLVRYAARIGLIDLDLWIE
jgi:DNA-binding CsgD family transcriptional regulator